MKPRACATSPYVTLADAVEIFGPDAPAAMLLPALFEHAPVIREALADGRAHLSGREVRTHLGVSAKALRTARDSQGLPCLPVGGEYRYPIADLLVWERERAGDAVPPRGPRPAASAAQSNRRRASSTQQSIGPRPAGRPVVLRR